MRTRFLSLLAAPLLVAGCASLPDQRPPAAQLYPAGMVSAADPRAAEAGAEMLRQGGNATDAAIATMLALTVVEPQSSGIGGGGFYVATNASGAVETIDGRETAPAAAHPKWFQKDGVQLRYPDVVPGGTSAGVPGNIALAAKAHGAHGRLPWSALFQPAIKLARDGFVVSPRLHEMMVEDAEVLGFTAEGKALYFGADGKPAAAGTTIRNPAIAAFYERVAAEGRDAFYTGANARDIVARINTAPRNPAPIVESDVTAYQAKGRAPVCGSYRGYKVCSMGPPSSGATTLLATLIQLERFDMKALGKDSPTAWHLIAESERLAYADRARYLADWDFVKVPVAGLIDRDYLARRSALISPTKAMASVGAGVPPGADGMARADSDSTAENGTSHFVAIDRAGNAVTYTSTIESSFGSGLIVNGYFLNNELTDFELRPEIDGRVPANKVEGGKRPRSSMTPTLVFAPDGKLRLAVGAAGGWTIPAQVIRVVIGVVDWDLSAQDAIALPVILAPGGNTLFVEQGTPLEAMIPALRQFGHTDIQARPPMFKANAIEVRAGRLFGAVDPRSEGKAVGE
jgi:gamma-glutamyltranspeptidase/glutathione hydrolase